jgi:hypothetical protein
MQQRRILRVFLASPGDLVPERQAAREIVADLNDVVGREFGIHIDLLGWEDTMPGAGRPQALINEDVDQCDLFIGVLWKRWGMPTGTATSGFHEEFTRAFSRNKDASSPELWLAFKQVDAGALADPGEQLKQVLEFKAEITNSRGLLYKEFISTQDWSRELQRWLLKRVAQLAKQQSDLTARGQNPDETTRSAPAPTGPKDHASGPLPVELKTAAYRLASATDKTEQALDDTLQDELTLLRVQLLADSYAIYYRTSGLLNSTDRAPRALPHPRRGPRRYRSGLVLVHGP